MGGCGGWKGKRGNDVIIAKSQKNKRNNKNNKIYIQVFCILKFYSNKVHVGPASSLLLGINGENKMNRLNCRRKRESLFLMLSKLWFSL